MNIFEIIDSFDPENPIDEESALLWGLEKGYEEYASDHLDRVGMLDRATAGTCLNDALTNCSAELFGKLLDHAPRGEYAGWWSAESYTPPTEERPLSTSVQVSGTLPTLAAAMGKTEHLRLLLDWGCDVNGASQDAASALADSLFSQPKEENGTLFRGFPTVRQESKVWWPCSEPAPILSGLTPLAAGVVFGNVSCVRLLLQREGVWLTETLAVSEALVPRGWPWWDTEVYRECRRLVRTRPDGSLRPLALWAAVRRMDAATLRDELDRCAYEREEVIHAVLAVEDCELEVQERWEMRSVLGERYPEALRDERVQRHLADLICCDFRGKNEPLPEVVEQALGDTVDLSESMIGMGNFSAPLAELYLKRLGEKRRLVMSRDAVCWPILSPITAAYLRMLLRHVEFRAPSLPVGVSGLTGAILQSGDVRLLRQALNRGLIPAEEPIGMLLELAGKNPAARALLLTRQRPSLDLAPVGAERSSYRELSADEQERMLEDPALRAMASDALLFRVLINRNVDDSLGKPLCWDGFETREYATLCALRGETDIALRFAPRFALWSSAGAENPNVAVVERADMSGNYMYLTQLCCAAAGGQTETVRALLDAGFDPEERDMGQPSVLTIVKNDPETLSLSPLLCALLWERWETAALLLTRGARCDLTCYTVRRLFEKVRGGDVPYVDIRRELGTYLEGRQLRQMD